MKIFKPDWINHTRKLKVPIFSIHINPINNKIATGGQDYRIKIWNFHSLQKDEECDLLLSTLVLHDGAVLCVRWSSDGRYLASCGDDTKICIWELDHGLVARSNFGSDVTNIENYRVVKIMIGHESDVADLAWSPCKQYLASCGFDSKVCVWAANSFERITTIEQHTGFVKGVTWDPAGQYLATQSDDLSVKIFRVSDWRVEKDIVKPFVGVTSTTFFRRLSWSPDGAAVCTVNGESGGCGVAPILYRQDWQSAVVLVGHEAPVEVASFNPHLFKHNDEANGKQVDTAVVALGSQDCGISVWWSGGARAICCAQQIFEGSVMDMAWTADGMGLLSCSYDGTICYMEFDESEFGTLTSKSDLDKTLNKYGNHGTKNLIPESADTIRIEKMFAEKGAQMLANRLGQGSETSVGFGTVNTQHEDTSSQPLQAPSIVPAQPVTPTRVPIASAEKQHESVTKDGKRRIRPVLIESNRSSLPDPVVTQSSQSANPIGVKKARMDLSANTLPMESSGVQYQLPVVVVQESHSNLQIPARRSVFSIDYTCKITDRHDTIEFKNTTSSCSIIATQGGEIVWTMVYKSPCLLATRGSTFLALAFADCTLQLVTTQAGQMILPPIKTLSAISILVAVDQYLLYIDCIGSLKLLNVEEMNPKLTTTILGLFKDNTSISSVNIHETGEPIITTTANESFLFSLKLQSWLQITLTSNHFEKIPRSLPKLDQIEHSLVSAKQLKDTKSVMYWLKLYAKRLSDEAATTKLKELLAQYYSKNENDLCSETGLKKRELFMVVAEQVSANRAMQRVLGLYSDALLSTSKI